MRSRAPRFARFLLVVAAVSCSANSHRKPALPAEIVTAKTVYFVDKTAAPAVGAKAMARLRKWGRFRLVHDAKKADLILLLSADPYKGGWLIYSGGETGSIDAHGNLKEDRIPRYNIAAPTRYAYLTVIDPKTGKSLWTQSRRWGGLLTGLNSAGERLVGELEKEVGRRAGGKATH